MPLVGYWREVAQITCFGTEVTPERRVEELYFVWGISFESGKDFTGQLSVTWDTFDDYIDYSGTFVARGYQNGTLRLQIDSANYRPTDVDAEGSFEHCNDELVLRNLWLGTARDVSPSLVPMCGHRFKKQLR